MIFKLKMLNRDNLVNDNILIMPALIAHMLYQEFLRFKLSNSII